MRLIFTAGLVIPLQQIVGVTVQFYLLPSSHPPTNQIRLSTYHFLGTLLEEHFSGRVWKSKMGYLPNRWRRRSSRCNRFGKMQYIWIVSWRTHLTDLIVRLIKLIHLLFNHHFSSPYFHSTSSPLQLDVNPRNENHSSCTWIPHVNQS